MIVKSKFKNYSVHFNETLDFFHYKEFADKVFFIIDKKVFHIYQKYFGFASQEQLFLLEAIEENKTIDTALMILDKMMQANVNRNMRLVSIGGGITQDISGFVANILFRGVSWTFIPTTLLSASDSCIGGKTSLNYKKYKNLLGTFYPPDNIYICAHFFDSLEECDYLSGLGEIVKFGIMGGKEKVFQLKNDIELLKRREFQTVVSYVISSLEYKINIIEIDEFDQNDRVKLNFGHTFGHGIEKATQYKIPHGTAVAIGVLIANEISFQRGYIDQAIKKNCEELLYSIIPNAVSLNNLAIDEIIQAIKRDKKQIGNKITAVLIKENGGQIALKLFHDLKESEVIDSINTVFLKGF